MSETINDDDFEAAFARLAAQGDNPPPVEEPKATDAVVEPPVEEPKDADAVVEPPVEEPKDADAVVEPLVEEPVVEPVVEAPKPSPSEDLLSRLVDRLAPAEKVPAAPTPAAAPQPEPELYTADEKALLTKYEEEWPDVARAETLRRKGEYREVVGYVFREVASTLGPLLEQMAEIRRVTETVAERAQLADLQGRVSDYEGVRDKVVDWVEKQPAYLKTAYTQVVEKGTVDEITDLIDRWRKDTGVTATPKAAVVPARKAETELPPAAKQAAAALAPVSSKRSAVVAGLDPGDFDSAFKMADETL